MRCADNNGDCENVKGCAAILLEQGSLQPEQLRETKYRYAKALLATSEEKAAEIQLAELASDTRSVYGAEGKYMLTQLFFDQKRYTECEKEIFNYMETSTPHTYWLARSFILLADLYTAQERTAEAKQYLLSLQSNYNEDDDIKDMIAERLNKITAE
jgi:TolA-binding protein